MGRDFQSLTHSENKVADSFLAILEPSREKIAFLAVNFTLPQWLVQRIPWRLNQVIENEVGFLRRLCHQTVADKRIALQQSKTDHEELEADILGSMMQCGDFTDNELVDQMLTFLAAGVSRPPLLLPAYSQLTLQTARNHRQRSDLVLLPALPESRRTDPSERGNPRCHSLCRPSRHLERARIHAPPQRRLPGGPPPIPYRARHHPRGRPRHHRRRDARPERHAHRALPLRHQPQPRVLGRDGRPVQPRALDRHG